MDKFKLDALVAPTAGPAWITDLINGDHVCRRQFERRRGCRVSEYQCDGVDIFGDCRWAFRFFGRAWSEPTLLKIAYSFEQLTQARQKPRLPGYD
jgi:amidase